MKKCNDKKIEVLGTVLRLIILVSLFVLIILNYQKLIYMDIRELLDKFDNRFLAGAVVLLIYATKGFIIIMPAILIYISVGASFSVFAGILINCLGVFIELSTAYFLGRFLGGEYINKSLQKQKYGEKILELSDRKRYLAIFIFRVIPVFPLDFISLFLGSRKINFAKYMIYSFLGVLPRVIVLSVLGYKIFDYISMKFIIIFIVVTISITIIFFAIREMIKLKDEK
ncbi:MAG: TVP38/TMEM64 family protein [Candidatus Fimenecus sp.]